MYSTYTHAVCLTASACPALQEEYLQSHCGEETHSLLHKMVEGTALMDFVHSRPIPYRSCDFFDEVCASFCHSYVTPSPPHLHHTITFTPPPITPSPPPLSLPFQLMARYIEHPESYTAEKMYSKEHISHLAEELLQLVSSSSCHAHTHTHTHTKRLNQKQV